MSVGSNTGCRDKPGRALEKRADVGSKGAERAVGNRSTTALDLYGQSVPLARLPNGA
jgi:hypothetical protein